MAEIRARNEEAEIDLDQIVHNAVATVQNDDPHGELTLRVRLALFLAAIIVVANAVIGIYNSIALREEVQCDHQLTNALNVVGDQNRSNTKQVIDTVLSGKAITAKQLKAVRDQFDAAYDANTEKRKKLLKTTCSDGSKPTPSVPSGS